MSQNHRPLRVGRAPSRLGKHAVKLLFVIGMGAAFSGVLAAPPADAGAAIKRVSAESNQRQSNIVLDFSKPLGNAIRSFSTVDPPRLVIDLPPMQNTTGQSSFEALSPDVRSVSIVQSESKTRVVMNLRQPMEADLQTKGNQLVVGFRNYTAAGKAMGGDQELLKASSLTSLDFRRGKESEGRIVLDFSGTDIRPEVRTESGQLVLELQGSGLADALQKTLDLSDYGTPVKSISTRRVPGGTVIKILTSGFWEHATYQENKRLILDLKPLSSDPTRSALLSKTRQFKGEQISLNFQNADVRSLLQVFAEFTNMNIIASDTVSGNVTLRLKNVPWDQAMDIVLKSKGLDIRQTGNVLLVAPAAELAQREQSELQAKTQLNDLEPLRMESFSLNYQKADDVVALITNDRQRMLSRRGSAVRDARTNQVFVQDVPAQLDQIRKLITRLDVPVRQVMIEARVVIADSTFASQLGARLGYLDARGIAPNTGGSGSKIPGTGTYGAIGSSQDTLRSTTGQTSAGLVFPDPGANTNLVNLPAQPINSFAPSTVAFSLFNSKLTQFVNLELSALEADGKGRVISSPRVITADQVKAMIEQGTEFPYTSASSSGATTVSFRKANLKLEVTPQITPEGGVILDVDVTKDAKGEIVQAGVAIDTKHVQTKVLVENGGTVVIGGIFEQDERDNVVKTPFFGDLPVVGHLFKTSSRSNRKTELMVFLTPRVLSNNSR